MGTAKRSQDPNKVVMACRSSSTAHQASREQRSWARHKKYIIYHIIVEHPPDLAVLALAAEVDAELGEAVLELPRTFQPLVAMVVLLARMGDVSLLFLGVHYSRYQGLLRILSAPPCAPCSSR